MIANPFQLGDLITIRRAGAKGVFVVRQDPEDKHFYLEGPETSMREIFGHGGCIHSLRLPAGAEVVEVRR